jgi:DNA-binding SARP family transcriptional activator
VSAGPTAIAEVHQPFVHVRLLDGFLLEVDRQPVDVPSTVQRLLAFLALHAGAVHRAYTAGVLWIDVPEERAGANLRSTLWRMRQLGIGVVIARNGTLRLDPCVCVDVHDASALARRWIASSVTDNDIDFGTTGLESDLLPDWYDDWITPERERFRQLRLHALEARSDRCMALGRLGDALIAALAAVVADPLRESAHRALIRVHLAEGNTGEAIRQARRYERLLRDELGVVPSIRLAELIA